MPSASAARRVEQRRQRVRILGHREVAAGDLDRLDAEHFARDEALPLGREELVVDRVDSAVGTSGCRRAGTRRRRTRRAAVARRARAPCRPPGAGTSPSIAASASQTPRPASSLGGNGKPVVERLGGAGRHGERAEPRAEVDEQRRPSLGRDERRLRRRERMPDDDDRIVDALERPKRRARPRSRSPPARRRTACPGATASCPRPRRPSTTPDQHDPSCHCPWMRQNVVTRPRP